MEVAGRVLKAFVEVAGMALKVSMEVAGRVLKPQVAGRASREGRGLAGVGPQEVFVKVAGRVLAGSS